MSVSTIGLFPNMQKDKVRDCLPDILALLQKYGIAESDCTNLMLLIVKTVQMAADGNLKAVEFIRDTLGENPQYKIYEKRLEYLIADKEAAHTLADEWVASIPDWEE